MNRASVVCSASASGDGQDDPGGSHSAAPLGRFAGRGRRQHDQHFLEAGEIDRRPDDDRACRRRRSSRPIRPDR